MTDTRKYFLSLAYQRLADGREEYGNASTGRKFAELRDEIEQEVLDAFAWAEMLSHRAFARGKPEQIEFAKRVQDMAYQMWVELFFPN